MVARISVDAKAEGFAAAATSSAGSVRPAVSRHPPHPARTGIARPSGSRTGNRRSVGRRCPQKAWRSDSRTPWAFSRAFVGARSSGSGSRLPSRHHHPARTPRRADFAKVAVAPGPDRGSRACSAPVRPRPSPSTPAPSGSRRAPSWSFSERSWSSSRSGYARRRSRRRRTARTGRASAARAPPTRRSRPASPTPTTASPTPPAAGPGARKLARPSNLYRGRYSTSASKRTAPAS